MIRPAETAYTSCYPHLQNAQVMSLKRFLSSCLKAFRNVQSRCAKRYHLSQRSSMSGVSMRDRNSVTTEVSFLEYDMKIINNNSETFDNTWNEKMERGWRACSN